MVSKSLAIQKAWGKYWDWMTDEMRQEALSQNGVFIGSSADFENSLSYPISQNKDFNYFYFTQYKHGIYKWKIYPKSLEGIDDNNGWTVVTKDTLPTEPGHYRAIRKGGDSLAKFINLRLVEGYNIKALAYIAEYCSHYRKLEEDKMPIY